MSLPETVRGIVLDAGREFYRRMSEPWPVFDVLMDEALDYVNREIEKQQDVIDAEAPRWYTRWENSKTDEEVKKAIDALYGKLRKAERPLRGHARKKPAGQLDKEIADTLRRRRR
jgi:hypothetical protein